MALHEFVWMFDAGFGMEAIFLFGVGYTKDNAAAITCLTIAVGFSGFAISGLSDCLADCIRGFVRLFVCMPVSMTVFLTVCLAV